MKVLFIHHIRELHGSTLSLFSLIKGLKRRGVEVAMIVPSNMPEDPEFSVEASNLDINIYPVNLTQSIDHDGWSKRPWMLRIFFHKLRGYVYQRKVSYRQICGVIEKENPDIVHTNVGIIHDGFWAAKKYNLPHVFHLREYQDLDFKWNILPSKRLFCLMLKRSSAVCAITNKILTHFGLDKQKNAITIYNGIYPSSEATYDGSKENYFLIASRLSPEKGIEDVIRAFAHFRLSHQDWKLKIAGTACEYYKNQLLSILEELNCVESVVFLGYVTNVKSLMSKARALIVGSYNEGFGRMTAEAAFNGCLVIGRDTAGTKEIMDSVGGFPFLSQAELIKRMDEVAELSLDEYRVKAQTSQQMAISLYSIEQNVEKTLEIYNIIRV